ncbi:MAG: FliO/MopB family protein [Deltaproteobacteria bacterium]|nr:FliO/MopB family protein [Deltaproteobacteria bacterium]MBN2672254.1 FliO/MopB family protein [Deltaproteobacteria bacterium]
MCSVGLLNSSIGALGIQFAAVVSVLAVIAGAAYVSVRFFRPQGGDGGRNRRMRRIESLTLEPRRTLHLVHIDDREIVVGISEGGMQFHEVKTAAADSVRTDDSEGGESRDRP